MKRTALKRKTRLQSKKTFEQRVRARLRRHPPKKRHGDIVSAIWRRDLGGCVVCPFEGGTCSGQVEAHHLIPASVLRKHGLAAFLMDLRNRAAVCSHRHEQITTAYKPFPVELLPDSFFEFAADTGLMWWVDKHLPAADGAAAWMSNRRLDGRLRPSVIRARCRRRGVPFVTFEAVELFKARSDARARIWNSLDLRDRLQIDVAELGYRLEAVAEQQRWMKLRDTAGVVRAIAVPRNHPSRRAGVDMSAYRAHVVALVIGPIEWEQAA